MSLINQMLKDLEHRRSQDQGSEGVIPGVRRYSVATRQRSPWFVILSIVILGLVLIVNFLLWERYSNTPVIQAAPEVKSVKPTQDTLAEERVSRLEKQPVAKKEPVPVVHPVKKIKPTKEVVKEQDPVPVVVNKEQKRSIKNNRQSDVITTAGSERVKKVSRPLNPKQQSEVLYQKGYGLLAAGRSHEGEQALREALTLIPSISKHAKC